MCKFDVVNQLLLLRRQKACFAILTFWIRQYIFEHYKLSTLYTVIIYKKKHRLMSRHSWRTLCTVLLYSRCRNETTEQNWFLAEQLSACSSYHGPWTGLTFFPSTWKGHFYFPVCLLFLFDSWFVKFECCALCHT